MAKNYQFSVGLKQFAKQLDLDLSTVVRKVSFDIWNDVTRLTPVDTGRARASWNITEEIANLSTKPKNYKNQSGKGEIGSISGKRNVMITNNVEYIELLENGSSKKAPAGMVRVALANAAASIKVAY
jgi:hypothetical protein|tara:strand:- start:986 stop:1366 length:381 start_codon:yes stop_codon:yes gene_type:complete